jgi:hypothetical protein
MKLLAKGRANIKSIPYDAAEVENVFTPSDFNKQGGVEQWKPLGAPAVPTPDGGYLN